MTRKWLRIVATVIGGAVVSSVGVRAGVVPLASDPSWAVAVMNPDETPGAEVGGAQCYAIPVAFDPSQNPDACVIWIPGWTPATPADMAGAFFTKDVFVPGVPIAGTLEVAVDDWVQIVVNGVVIGSRGSLTDIFAAYAAQNPPVPFDIQHALHSGLNTIQVWARNGPSAFAGNCAPCPWSSNGAWVYFGGSITYDNPVPVAQRTWGQVKAIYR